MTTTFTTENASTIPAAMRALINAALPTLTERDRSATRRVVVFLDSTGMQDKRNDLAGGFFCKSNRKVEKAVRALAGIDAIVNANAAVSQ